NVESKREIEISSLKDVVVFQVPSVQKKECLFKGCSNPTSDSSKTDGVDSGMCLNHYGMYLGPLLQRAYNMGKETSSIEINKLKRAGMEIQNTLDKTLN